MSDKVTILNILENVDHCGGEPEQADTETVPYTVNFKLTH